MTSDIAYLESVPLGVAGIEIDAGALRNIQLQPFDRPVDGVEMRSSSVAVRGGLLSLVKLQAVRRRGQMKAAGRMG